MYYLKARTHAFASTGEDAIDSVFSIARSESKERIEALFKILGGDMIYSWNAKENPILKEIIDFENSNNFWYEKKTKTFKINILQNDPLSKAAGVEEIIEIRYFPVDNFYGSGSLCGLFIDPPIELEPEIEPPLI